jgi:FAD/FMN-containing dehydrogenase
MTTTVQPTTHSPATQEALGSLASLVAGRVTTTADAGYDRARTPWVVNVDQRPAAVLEVVDVDDVVAAVRWGAAHGVPVAVQPGGHAPRTTLDGTLLLRTRALQGIDVDPVRRTVTVGAGVDWGQLCDALDGTGLMALCGSNPDVTVVGLTLGGGVSWFTRKHGFTANSVVSFDVVGADGELRHVTRSSDPDLFWALRGGGGDFAVVVRMELALFDAAEMYGGQLMWPVEHAPDVLRAFRDLALVAPRELSLWAHVMHFPPIPDVPEPLRGKSFVTVASTYLGDAKMAEILLWSLRDAAPVAVDLMGPVTPATLAAVAAEPTEPMPALEHSLLMTGFDDDAIEALVAAVGEDVPTGGAVRPVPEPFQLFAMGVPAVPELAAAIPHGFAAIDAALAHVTAEHRMPNFTAADQADEAGYDVERLTRLRTIKRVQDPQGVIRSNKPV